MSTLVAPSPPTATPPAAAMTHQQQRLCQMPIRLQKNTVKLCFAGLATVRTVLGKDITRARWVAGYPLKAGAVGADGDIGRGPRFRPPRRLRSHGADAPLPIEKRSFSAAGHLERKPKSAVFQIAMSPRPFARAAAAQTRGLALAWSRYGPSLRTRETGLLIPRRSDSPFGASAGAWPRIRAGRIKGPTSSDMVRRKCQYTSSD